MRLAYVYVFLFIPLKSPLEMLELLLRLVERLLVDLLEDVLLEDFDGVRLVLFEVDDFFLLLFNEPKSKLMIYWGGIIVAANKRRAGAIASRKSRLWASDLLRRIESIIYCRRLTSRNLSLFYYIIFKNK